MPFLHDIHMFGFQSLSPSALHSTSKLENDLLSSDTPHGILRPVAQSNGDLVRQSNGQQPRPAHLANCEFLHCVYMSFITQAGVVAQADLIIGKAPRASLVWLSLSAHVPRFSSNQARRCPSRSRQTICDPHCRWSGQKQKPSSESSCRT